MKTIDYTTLGAIEQKQKPSDFELGAIASAEPLPLEYKTPYTGTIYHQHKTPSCGAHAGVYIKNIQENRTHSPAYLWKRIKQIDGFAPENGTSMEAIFKALQKWGVCELSLMPNNTEDTLANYTNPKDITDIMDKNALKSRIGAYAFTWNPTSDQLKRAIYDHKAVLMLLRIGQEFWTPSWKESDILPLVTKYSITSGHFVVAYAYDEKYIYFLNEWGTEWGRIGIGYFDKYYMPRVVQIGTCFDFIEQASNIFTRTLKFDMRGTDVGILQQMLKDKGYFPESQKITSYFGRVTLDAVTRFQKSQDLIADGVVGQKTQEALLK